MTTSTYRTFLLLARVGCGTILAALIIPKITGRQCSACINPTQSEEASLASCLHQFHLDCGRYPTTKEGLQSLHRAPPGLERKAKEPYLTDDAREPVDEWGRPFLYQCPGVNQDPDTFTITSLGPTGKLGGTGEDSPIVDAE